MPDPLDTMLDTLRADVPEMSDQAFAAGRARVQAVTDPIPVVTTPEPEPVVVALPKRRPLRSPPARLLRLAGAAAAVVALAAGVVAVQSGGHNAPGKAPISLPIVTAASVLQSAADNVNSTDPVVAPGQYRYIVHRAWDTATTAAADGKPFAVLAETLIERWVPREWHDEWLLRRQPTGNVEWLLGTAEEAEEAGVPIGPDRNEELRARCGDFYVSEDVVIEPCTEDGNWQSPTPEFMAGLPRDPAALHAMLKTGTGGEIADPEVVVTVADLLRSGLVPADLRAALYRALALLPGLEITEDVANLAGKHGTAFGIDSDIERQDLIIDPATGEFIGERTVALAGGPLYPAGTVISFSSVSTTVVDAIGMKPTG